MLFALGSNQPTPKEELLAEPQKQIESVETLVDRTDLASRYVPLSVPFSKLALQKAVQKSSRKKTVTVDTAVDMEEVKPPELWK